MTLYGREFKHTYYGTEYRWYSKYNGARGPWVYHKSTADKGEEEHQKIIETVFNIESPGG